MVRELTAFLAELRDRNLILVFAFGAVLLFDLPLDRQAVAIPTRHIIRVFTHHLLRSVDHIFQDLVQGVTNMEIAVRVWRTIMQNKRLASFGRFTHASPQVHIRPALQQFRLAFRQPGLHRKVGLRQTHRFLIIYTHRFGSVARCEQLAAMPREIKPRRRLEFLEFAERPRSRSPSAPSFFLWSRSELRVEYIR